MVHSHIRQNQKSHHQPNWWPLWNIKQKNVWKKFPYLQLLFRIEKIAESVGSMSTRLKCNRGSISTIVTCALAFCNARARVITMRGWMNIANGESVPHTRLVTTVPRLADVATVGHATKNVLERDQSGAIHVTASDTRWLWPELFQYSKYSITRVE